MSHQPQFAAVKATLPKVEAAATVALSSENKGGAKKEKQKDEGANFLSLVIGKFLNGR